jgi:outer membrane protein insertion porin family
LKKQIIASSLLFSTLLLAQDITDIQFLNLSKISPDIANDTLNMKIGDEIDVKKINTAIKKFYRFGYFDNITVENNNGALILSFKEKPSIAQIDISGYKTRKEDIDMLLSSMGLKKGNMYSKKRIANAKEALLNELKKEGYIDSVVEADITNLNDHSVAVTFNVRKGDKIIIKKVNYNGAKNLDEDNFEPATANKEEDFITWWFGQNDGELKLDQLQYDHLRIQETYLENGYLDAKVKEPFLKVDFNSANANLDFFIDEGKQYRINDIKIYVDEDILKAEDIYPELLLKKGKVFNVKRLRKDQKYIKTQVANKGYAFAQIRYDIQKNTENGTADIVYNVLPGEKVYINDVIISGNSRTLDRVIRRNVFLAPQDLYNETDFIDSKGALQRSGFFERTTIEKKRLSNNTMDLIVKVTEAQTGNIIVGGGYGSYDGMMVNASINDRNVFGSGLNLGVSIDWSKRKSDFTLSLANPAINDSEYSGSIAAYNQSQEIDYTDYDLDKKTLGMSVGIGKALTRHARIGATYKLENIEETYTNVVAPTVKTNKDYIHSSITPYISFNNTDDYYLPRKVLLQELHLNTLVLVEIQNIFKVQHLLNIFMDLKI